MFRDEKIKTADGLALHVRLYGEAPRADGPLPLVCLPGLTRNGRDFHGLAQALSEDPARPRQVITLDSRGRGGSERDPDPSHYTVPVEAGDVVTVLTALGIGRADFIGTSRGGLILHVLSAMAPDLLGRLVLNDIGPVIELEGMREIQAYLDPAPQPRTREQVIDGLRQVHGPSFPALEPQDWEDMADALYRAMTDGRLIADFDPAIAAATKAIDLSQPLPHLWALFDQLAGKPLLVIRGEHTRLLSRATVEEMARRHEGLQVVEATGQGHAPLLHKPALLAAISDFLDGAET